jgi:uncharacterized protein
MSDVLPKRVHVISGGFPPGSPSGHDFDYARLRLLQLLSEIGYARVTVTNDFADVERWLSGSQMLITYVAGPFPDPSRNELLREWLDQGGRWLALHGTSGGKAEAVDGDRRVRRMVKMNHHQTLGSFFLNHPPICEFRVRIVDRDHPLTKGIPESFDVTDELYMIELTAPDSTHLLMTTEMARDPSPAGFGFVYDRDTALMPDGKSRALGYVRDLGKGGVAYFALGHCLSAAHNMQSAAAPNGVRSEAPPKPFRGAWDSPAFERLLRNAIEWGCGASA